MSMRRNANREPERRLPRLCVVGQLIGRNRNHVTTQGELLASLLADAGYLVQSVSGARNRYVRLVDIVATLVRARRSIDSIVVQTYSGPSFVIADAATGLGRWNGHEVILHLHGGDLPRFMARHPRWTRNVLGRADAIIAPSRYLADAVEPFGYRAAVIPNVIDTGSYPFRHREHLQPRLFWMRSFHPIYNPLMAVRVMARVRVRFPEVELVMAGQDKGMQGEVQRAAARLGLGTAIRFPGFLEPEAKIAEGERADIFINTNHIDNAPVAVIEAGAFGLPVVSTNVGGIADLLVDEETGLLVGDDDDEAMAHAIFRLLGDPPLAAHLSQNGRALAERSSREQVLVKWRDLFAGSVDRRKGGSLPTRPHHTAERA